MVASTSRGGGDESINAIQQALLQVLQKRWDPTFSEHSYGFRCSGRRRFTDGVLAHVRTPGVPTSPAQPLFRLTRSPPTPCLCPSLTQSNRRGTDPYARWWGRGGIARCPPIPIYGAIRSPGQPARTSVVAP